MYVTVNDCRLFFDVADHDDVVEYRSVRKRLYAAHAHADDARTMVPNEEDVMRHFLAPGGASRSMDLRASLAAITCPTLVPPGTEAPAIRCEVSRERADAVVGSATPAERRFMPMGLRPRGLARRSGPRAGRDPRVRRWIAR